MMLVPLLSLGMALAVAPTDTAPGAEWRQILNVPRVGGRLTALSVDADNPLRIFVGTEAGTVLLTDDGGVTWTEVDIDARAVRRRSTGLPAPGLPRLGDVAPQNFAVKVDPPWRRPVDRITLNSVANPFPIRPAFFWAGFLATSKDPKPSLLRDAIQPRRSVQPVRRIALCRGALYEVLVATRDALYGSMDGGLTYVRLFASAGRTFLEHAECSRADPRRVAVATSIGLFLSDDGGLTFDQDLSAWPGKRSTAIAFVPAQRPGELLLFSAANADLFAGDPTSADGLSNIYPTDPSTAPWRAIRWIADDDDTIYLATDDGVRASPDRGKTWKTVARSLLSRQAVGQVVIGESETGAKRVALLINVRPQSMKGRPVSGLQDSLIYASDDGGTTFFPFFHGLSRRTLRQMSAVRAREDRPCGWWVATSSEVWTSYPRGRSRSPHVAARSWAERRMKTTPSLQEVIRTVLEETHLSMSKVRALGASLAATGLLPKLELYLTADLVRDARFRGIRYNPAEVAQRQFLQGSDQTLRRDEVFALVQLTWNTGHVLRTSEDFGSARRHLHIMRRQVELATEDAYHERTLLLSDLVEGRSHPIEIESLKTRILSLEAIMATWMRRPFPGAES